MNELITKIQTDPTLMLVAILSLVVLLVIVLTIVVSAMRVKTYKNRFWNLQVDYKDKAEYVRHIEQELQKYKIDNAKNEQELAQFLESKNQLKKIQDQYDALQSETHELEKEFTQVKVKLESIQSMYSQHIDEHLVLKERFDSITEENAKYRVNNARLLMKLESEERQLVTIRTTQDKQEKI